MTSLEIFPLLSVFIALIFLQELENISGYLGRYFHYKKKSEATNGKPYFSIPLLPYAGNASNIRQRMQNNFGVRGQNKRYLLTACNYLWKFILFASFSGKL